MIKNLNKKEWYYWGRWNQVMLFHSPWLEVIKAAKLLGLDFLKGDVLVLRGHYYFSERDLEKFYDIIVKNICNRSNWFKKYFVLCETYINKMKELEKKGDLKEFIEFLVEYFGFFTLLEFVDLCLEKYLNKLCLQFNIPVVVITNKMHPRRKTLLMRYHSELKNIDSKEIDSFIDKYKWVGTHGFEGPFLTKSKVLSELRISHKTNQASFGKFNIKIPGDFRQLISMGRNLIFYRSERIDVFNKTAFSYRQKMRELAKKHGLSYFDIISCTHYELLDLIEKHRIPKDLKKRKKNFGIVYINGKYSILLGKDLKQVLGQLQPNKETSTKELIGTVAYPGRIIGRAKVMRSSRDVSRVREGDIIVAETTTPEYILAMKKAGAFVTNQGGITSHAAIIAREMKKPCIIGTKIATKVLKDGQLIEVDADKGIVRILK